MRIVVTGGAGFIGSHVVDRYIAEGHHVAIIDNLWDKGGGKKANINPAATFYEADIRDREAVRRIFEQEKPEILNHHAAQASVKISTDDPILDADVNVIGLLTLVQEAVRVGTHKIIFASSGATYGTPLYLPVDVQHPQHPESPYGITKMVSEYYLRYYMMSQGLTYTAFRYGNVYGPRQDPHGEAGVIAIFTMHILKNDPVRIDWDGEQQKDYIYVGDVANANVKALTLGDNEIFNIATGKGTSVNELYNRLTDLIGNKVEIIHAPKRPGDIYKSYFDCSKAQNLLQWTSEVPLEEGLKHTVEYFRAKS